MPYKNALPSSQTGRAFLSSYGFMAQISSVLDQQHAVVVQCTAAVL